MSVPNYLYLPTTQVQEREYHYEFLKKDVNGKEKKLSFDFSFMHNGQTNDTPARHIIKLNRSNLLIDKESPEETLIGELVYHASQALFPLRLAVNSYGYPKSICNHPDILERWKGFIPRFQAYYEAGRGTKLLNHIGRLYKSPERLIESLQNDLFFSLFFFPIYGDYGLSRISTIDYEFPIIAGQKTKYSLDLELQENYTENGKLNILVDGKSELSENNTVLGHFLLNKDRSIYEIKIDFQIAETGESISITIFETKEIAERQTGINVVFDEKEEREKRNGRGFFVEEIEDSTNFPKRK